MGVVPSPPIYIGADSSSSDPKGQTDANERLDRRYEPTPYRCGPLRRPCPRVEPHRHRCLRPPRRPEMTLGWMLSERTRFLGPEEATPPRCDAAMSESPIWSPRSERQLTPRSPYQTNNPVAPTPPLHQERPIRRCRTSDDHKIETGSDARGYRAVDLFAALTLDWQANARADTARRSVAAWGEAAPLLAGFDTPGTVVAEINRPGQPARSCALLAELLVIARSDPMAGRAVLQAVTPGIRRAAATRWGKAASGGPWRTADEIAADAISAAWDAIDGHAGQHHPRPAQLIVRHVEAALRRTHHRWINQTKAHRPLHQVSALPLPDATTSQEEQAAALIAEAARAGVIDRPAALLLTMTGVLGYPATEAARRLAVRHATVERTIRRARRAIRIWLGLPDVTGEVSVEDGDHLLSGLAPRRYQVGEPARQLHPFRDESSQPPRTWKDPHRSP